MENCQYEEIADDSKGTSTKRKNVPWLPFLRQLLVVTGILNALFLYGLCVGAPTVFIPQIRKEANSSSIITQDMASWISSLHSFSGLLCVPFVTIATKFVGRKILFSFGIVNGFAAFLVLYYSSNVTHILVSATIQGLLGSIIIIISIMVLTEFTSPMYRGTFLMMKPATFYWGIWASNAIGTFCHWKIIPLFGMACTIYIFVTVIIWPESPYWLAGRGQFEECAASHRWLKGCDEESEKELKAIIKLQQEYIVRCDGLKLTLKDRITDLYKTMKSKEFYKPTLLSMTTTVLGIFSGKIVCVVYVIDIMKEITKNESIAYVGMLIFDGVTVFSMYLGCILARYFKRRTLLLIASCIGAGFLFMLSFYLYIITSGVVVENEYVSILLLAVLSIAISCGPLVIAISVCAELIPLRSRNLSTCLISVFVKILSSVLLKTAPLLFRIFGLHGVFLIFGLLTSMATIILYKYMPETKGKTLQEISDSIVGRKSNETHEALNLVRNQSNNFK